MEVLDNSPNKDSEDQSSVNNFTCRLSRDLNIGNSTVARNKGETDIRLLIACKAQLSSEVIKWKTESLRLQKERDSARIRMKELDQVLGKYAERSKELENRICIMENENKRLKEKLPVPSNTNVLQKLSVSLDKFHSYPWSNTRANATNSSNSCMNTMEKKNPIPQEDWKEVSQQLLEKMKQEMKELQELSCNLPLQENDIEKVNVSEKETCYIDGSDDKLDENLSDLISETLSVRQCLLEQRKNLKTLLNKALQGNIYLHRKDNPKDISKASCILQSCTEQSVQSIKPKPSLNQSTRHSDDSFREFFTKQLECCQNIDKMKKTMQLFMQSDSENGSHSNRSPIKVTSPKLKLQPQTDKTTEEERVCPICQVPFAESVPQNEFEEHVFDHLEVESASLLDQYVVL